jgi:hypothetical protein
VGSCFLGDGWMMSRSPTSSSPPEAAIAAGAEVEAPTLSSRWKRLGALGIILCELRCKYLSLALLSAVSDSLCVLGATAMSTRDSLGA